MEKSSNFQFVKSLGHLLFYGIVALGLFFLSAVLIFHLRSSERVTITMPDVMGKYYIDVHNDLNQSRLRISLKRRNYQDQPPGIVLFQSIAPGSAVKPGENVTLVVNQPEPVIRMPDLLGAALPSAKATLGRLAYQDEIYTLEIGAISYVPDSTVPANTVLMQFPPAGENVLIEERVYLLVSTKAEPEGESDTVSSVEDLVGQNITLVSQFFRQRELDYRIREVKHPDQAWKSGQVYKVEKRGSLYLLDVYYKKPSARFSSGYELVDLSLTGEGTCQVEQVWDKNTMTGSGSFSDERNEEVVFETRKHEEEEEVRIFFYRIGSVDLHGRCGSEEFYEERFEPGDFG